MVWLGSSSSACQTWVPGQKESSPVATLPGGDAFPPQRYHSVAPVIRPPSPSARHRRDLSPRTPSESSPAAGSPGPDRGFALHFPPFLRVLLLCYYSPE
jgi:hypothetical protein